MQEVLTVRALNRALLARQSLITPARTTAGLMIEQLVGMQSQAPRAPFVGLWSRLADFRPDELDTLMIERKVVRLTMMRGTIHLVTAADCLRLRSVLTPVVMRALFAASRRRDVDLPRVTELTRQILADGPVRGVDLGRQLAAQLPGLEPGDLLVAAHCAVPLVQVPPRGLWNGSGQPVNDTAEAWLGEAPLDSTDPSELIERYLRAFGPATVADIQAWSGLSTLRQQVEQLRPRLRTFINEKGQELLDVPDGLLSDPQTPVPVRIVAEFDNLVLSHADRNRVISDEHRRSVITINGQVRSTFLVDGFVAGMCKVSHAKKNATLTIEPFGQLARADIAALEAEGHRLLSFAHPDLSPEIKFS